MGCVYLEFVELHKCTSTQWLGLKPMEFRRERNESVLTMSHSQESFPSFVHPKGSPGWWIQVLWLCYSTIVLLCTMRPPPAPRHSHLSSHLFHLCHFHCPWSAAFMQPADVVVVIFCFFFFEHSMVAYATWTGEGHGFERHTCLSSSEKCTWTAGIHFANFWRCQGPRVSYGPASLDFPLIWVSQEIVGILTTMKE